MSAQAVPPLLAVTQGDPAGVGPELLLDLLKSPPVDSRILLIAEKTALEAAETGTPGDRGLVGIARISDTADISNISDFVPGEIALLDPVGRHRRVVPGNSGPEDAAGALACLDAGIEMARAGRVDALVTAPVSKESIAGHALPDFRGHTDYIAQACGLERYGRDYLMAFLAADLQVALLSTHVPLAQAVASLTTDAIVQALRCLNRHAGGRIAVAGLNPHAGEGGLLGREEEEIIAPAVAEARANGVDAHGPFSPDSLFSRARGGEFDWVLALYHDQGLIPVKTLSFGSATNWTLGLPFLRTSVDHGTAFEIAGRGVADVGPLRRVLEATTRLLAGKLPRKS